MIYDYTGGTSHNGSSGPAHYLQRVLAHGPRQRSDGKIRSSPSQRRTSSLSQVYRETF